MFSTCWHSTVSTQVSHTVRRLKTELCTAGPSRLAKTFPVEVRPSSRPPFHPCVRDKSNVLEELSRANITMNDSGEKIGGFVVNWGDQKSEIASKSSGLNLADQFILKYPRSFTMRFSDHAPSHECLISDACLKQDYVKGYEIFLSMKQNKKQIPLDNANKLLDLFCYHGYKNSKIKCKINYTEENKFEENSREETQLSKYTRFYKPTVTYTSSWSKENAASELFDYMQDKDALSYNLMIQSMIKYASGGREFLESAFAAYKEMISLDYKPSLDTCKALIHSTRYDTEVNLITLMRELFSKSLVKPDAELFVLLLEVLFDKESDAMEIRNATKLIMNEFFNSSITCSFGDFYKISVLLEGAHMKKYCYNIFHKMIKTRNNLLTVDKGNLEDYELLLHLVKDYSLMMSPDEVIDFLDYITDNKLVYMIGQRNEKSLFAMRLLLKYNTTGDTASFKKIWSKLNDVWKDDISVQLICVPILLKKTRVSTVDYAKNLIEMAEKLDDLYKLMVEPTDGVRELDALDKMMVEPTEGVRGDIMSKCDALYHYSNAMWLQCQTYIKVFDADSDMEMLKRIQEINIKLLLKMQENDIIPNQNTINSIIITTLYAGDILNAWKLFNLYENYQHSVRDLTLRELLKVSKMDDYRRFLSRQTLTRIKTLGEQHLSIHFAVNKANKEFNDSLEIL